MELLYDTEIETMQTDTVNDSLKYSAQVEDTEGPGTEEPGTEELEEEDIIVPVQTADEIIEVQQNNDPKTFEQSGYEVAVVFCLGIIIGLILWDSLSKRWHT